MHHYTGVILWYGGYDKHGTIILAVDVNWAVEVTPTETDVVWAALMQTQQRGSFERGCLVPCDNRELTDDQRKILNLAD